MILRGDVNSLIRRVNFRAVFLTIAREQPVSRIDLAKLCRLSKSTITACTDQLVKSGLVRNCDIGEISVGKGRPKQYLEIDTEAGVLASIHKDQSGDIGVMVTNLNGKILERFKEVQGVQGRKMSVSDYVETLIRIICRIRDTYQNMKHGLLGIGIDQSCVMDPKTGVIEYNSSDPGWKGFSLKQALERARLGVPIYLMRPAIAASLGEMVFGTLEQTDDCVFIVGSWGLGVAYFPGEGSDMDPMPVSASFAHSIIQENGRLCTCGNRGCLEAYASVRSLYNLTFPDKEYMPERFEQLVRESERAGSLVQEQVDDMWRYFSVGVLNIVNIFHPKTIVIGGREERFLKPRHLALIEQYVQQHALEHYRKDLKIEISSLKEDGPAFGGIAIAQRGVIDAMLDSRSEKSRVLVF